MRKVKFIAPTGQKMTGYFHAWGLDSHELRESGITWSIGIIEDLTGRVWKVLPEDITFVIEEN